MGLGTTSEGSRTNEDDVMVSSIPLFWTLLVSRCTESVFIIFQDLKTTFLGFNP